VIELPCAAEMFIPQRPPMLLVERLIEGYEEGALVEATVPDKGIFMDGDKGLLDEYLVELVAQAAAVFNGYDRMVVSMVPSVGYLVGVEGFEFLDSVCPGEKLLVEIKKKFEFGAVTIMTGLVRRGETLVARGEIRAWEEKK